MNKKIWYLVFSLSTCLILLVCQPVLAGTGEENDNCSKNDDCISGLTCQSGEGDYQGKNVCMPGYELQGGAHIESPPSKEVKWQPAVPKLQIDIPTLQPFTSADIINDPDTGHTYITFLGKYIKGIYKWGLLVAGTVAVILILMGAFVYMTAGGNAQRVEEGKKRMLSSLLGLLLLLGSYTILYLINPDLVKFKNLNIPPINRLVLGTEFNGVDTTATCPPPASPSKIPLFKQGCYSNYKLKGCGTISTSGCGPTSVAMVLKYYGKNVDPPQIAEELQKNGYRVCNPGASPTLENGCEGCGNKGIKFLSSRFLQKFQLKGVDIWNETEKWVTINTALKAEKPVVIAVSESIFSPGGHFIVLSGINEDGSYIINDPALNEYCSTGFVSKIKKQKCTGSLISPKHVPANYVQTTAHSAYLLEPL